MNSRNVCLTVLKTGKAKIRCQSIQCPVRVCLQGTDGAFSLPQWSKGRGTPVPTSPGGREANQPEKKNWKSDPGRDIPHLAPKGLVMRFSVWFVLGQGMRLTRNREAEAAGAGWDHLLKNFAWLGLVLGLQASPHSFEAREQNLFLPHRRHPGKKKKQRPCQCPSSIFRVLETDLALCSCYLS